MSITNFNLKNLNCKNIDNAKFTNLLNSYDGKDLIAKRKLHNIISKLIKHSAKNNYDDALINIFKKLIEIEKTSTNKNSITNTIIFIIDKIFFIKTYYDKFITISDFKSAIDGSKYKDYCSKIIEPEPSQVIKSTLTSGNQSDIKQRLLKLGIAENKINSINWGTILHALPTTTSTSSTSLPVTLLKPSQVIINILTSGSLNTKKNFLSKLKLGLTNDQINKIIESVTPTAPISPVDLEANTKFNKYHKMIKLGVLKEAVKQKMKINGLTNNNITTFNSIINEKEMFVGGSSDNSGIIEKIKNIYSENSWNDGYIAGDNANKYIYIYKFEDDNFSNKIVGICRINKINHKLDYDYVRPNFRDKKIYAELCNKRVNYVINNIQPSDTKSYVLYTEFNYLIQTHLNSGLFLVSKNKINVLPSTEFYYKFTTKMTNPEINNRIIEENLKDVIYNVIPKNDCTGTYISPDGYILSATHCSLSPETNQKNGNWQTKDGLDTYIFGDVYDGEIKGIRYTGEINKVLHQRTDMIIYKDTTSTSSIPPQNYVYPIDINDIKNCKNYKNCKILTYDKFTNQIATNDKYFIIFDFDHQECSGSVTKEICINSDITFILITSNKLSGRIRQGNSGGPLLIYYRDKFRILGELNTGIPNTNTVIYSIINKNILEKVDLYSNMITENKKKITSSVKKPINSRIKTLLTPLNKKNIVLQKLFIIPNLKFKYTGNSNNKQNYVPNQTNKQADKNELVTPQTITTYNLQENQSQKGIVPGNVAQNSNP